MFLSLNAKMRFLFLEAFFFLGWARILKCRPFLKVAPYLGDFMRETTHTSIKAHEKKINSISSAIEIMSRYTFWESACLVQAIAGMKMLQKRQIESTLYLGTAKDDTGKLIAHAWLRCGSVYITGSEGVESFTIVGVFASRINQKLSKEGYNEG